MTSDTPPTTALTSAPYISYVSVAFMKNSEPFPTFKEALKDFIERMKKELEKGASLMMFEAGSWIERRNSLGSQSVIYFYDAKDFGYATGLLAGDTCEFVPDAPEPDPTLISDLYTSVMASGTGENFINRLREARA